MRWRLDSCHFGETVGAAILAAILKQTPVAPVRLNPEVPVELERIINRALESYILRNRLRIMGG